MNMQMKSFVPHGSAIHADRREQIDISRRNALTRTMKLASVAALFPLWPMALGAAHGHRAQNMGQRTGIIATTTDSCESWLHSAVGGHYCAHQTSGDAAACPSLR